MPTGRKEWPRFDATDADDRKILIETGLIWQTGNTASMNLAIEDLVAGRVPLNSKVPPPIAEAVRKARGEA